ncbi:MAG: dihydropteroate synthase, partial [Caulobacteraceae bacterium]|nr:dihydropteroate synthase [Caulobacteraceae bacterium]
MNGPSVMGVVNVTPDSFSDGGRFFSVQAAVDHGLRLLDQGADMLDIGGESTRPGAEPLSGQAEIDRVLPVIEALRQSTPCPISIDTLKPEVARAAVRAGATIWNDVTALRGSDDAAAVAAELGVPVVLMHMQGEPGTMQIAPHYEDVVAEVCAFLSERADLAMAAGVAREAISLDPGIGFGKTLSHNLTLLAHLDQIMVLGFPVLLGVSRKRFVQAIDPTATEPTDRLGGALAAALAGARAGVDVIRVHDV